MEILLWIWCWGAVALFLGQVLGNTAADGAQKSLPRTMVLSIVWPVGVLWMIAMAIRDRCGPPAPKDRKDSGGSAG